MRCRGCDKCIEVKWWSPPGDDGVHLPHILESLCNTCLGWARGEEWWEGFEEEVHEDNPVDGCVGVE